MAVVTGDNAGLTGRVGNTIYYQSGGKTYARKATNAGKRDMNAPNMVRVRENNQEFVMATKHCKLIRLPFGKEIKGRIAGALSAEILAIAKQHDVTSARGTRNIANVAGMIGELKGYELNTKTTLDSVMLGANIGGGVSGLIGCELQWNDFTLRSPEGATHYSIVGRVAEYNLASNRVVQVSSGGVGEDPILADGQVSANTITIPVSTPFTAGNLVVAVAGVLFYQEVNGVMYQLNEGIKNPARIYESTFI